MDGNDYVTVIEMKLVDLFRIEKNMEETNQNARNDEKQAPFTADCEDSLACQ